MSLFYKIFRMLSHFHLCLLTGQSSVPPEPIAGKLFSSQIRFIQHMSRSPCVIMKIAYLLFLLILPLAASLSQTDDFSRIDSWVRRQTLQDTNLQTFTQQLTAPARNDHEKIRAIFQFVIRYLTYDHQASAVEQRRINQNIHDILNRKKGICWDYSQLICHMAGIAGLTCYVVSGFSKDIDQDRPVNQKPDHAWNIVKLDGTYYLLDATWESGTLSNSDAFKSTFKSSYFLTDPNLFIKNHFPGLAAFQLMSCPLTWEEFDSGNTVQQKDTCFFDFQDSIEAFLELPYHDQKMKEAALIYRARPNPENERSWGHAVIDKAILLKERGDVLFDKAEYSDASSHYEEALSLFTRGSEKTALYPWQQEAFAFCHLNYAQIVYRSNFIKGLSMQPVVFHLHEARALLETLNSSSFMIKSALNQIDHQLAAIE